MTKRLVVVTGVGGGGKTTALTALTDLGYECIDNLPASVVEAAVRACDEGGSHLVALGFQVGTGSLLEGAAEAIDRLKKDDDRDVKVVFLDAADQTLVRRYGETRRPHPLLRGASGETSRDAQSTSAVLDAIRLERKRLSPLRDRATFELDTSALSVHELRRRIFDRFESEGIERPVLMTRIVSFGYKYGVPIDANLLVDVRFIDNPYFVPALRSKTGLDDEVRDYVLKNPDAQELLSRIEDLARFVLPRYEQEGKAYLTLGVGCTGGQHRSVAIAEELRRRLSDTGRPIDVFHRDAPRSGQAPLRTRGAAGIKGGPA